MPKQHPRKLLDVVAGLESLVGDPAEAILSGRVLVEGRVVTNPRSLVKAEASVSLSGERVLRGELKLKAALETFAVDPSGRVALDAGASTGGFTKALLTAGARKVYAVDAGHGQLLGSLRQDPRVVNLENTNIGALDRTLIPDQLDLVTLDLSYVSLAEAAKQLQGLLFSHSAQAIALVKPMFELGLPSAPADLDSLDRATALATTGLERAGWKVLGSIDSPITGARGAQERFIHAISRIGAGRQA